MSFQNYAMFDIVRHSWWNWNSLMKLKRNKKYEGKIRKKLKIEIGTN